MANIRPYRDADFRQLAELYELTVRRWAPGLYSAAQVEAWATMPADTQRFRDMVARPRTFVAVDAGDQPIGFCGYEPAGRIASLYVAASKTRQGVGSRLLQHVVRDAALHRMESLWSEASQLSLPLFERNGFYVCNKENVEYNGAMFERWVVRCDLRLDT